MKKNMGSIDAVIRIILGLAIALAGFNYKSWWGLLAVLPLLTGFINICPLYSLLGINTCKKK